MSAPSPAAPVADVALVEILNMLGKIKAAINDAGDEPPKKMESGFDKIQKSLRGVQDTALKFAKSIGQFAGGFTSVFSTLASGFGVANSAIVQLAAAANPAAAVQLSLAYRTLTYQVGQLLQPVLQIAITWLRKLADTIYNASPALKAMAAGLGIATVAFVALAGAAMAFAAVMAVVDIETGGILLLIGAIVTAVVGAVAAFGAFGATSDTLKEAMSGLGSVMDDLMEILEAMADSAMDILVDMVKDLVVGFQEFWKIISPFKDQFIVFVKAISMFVTEMYRLQTSLMESSGVLRDTLIPAFQDFFDIMTEGMKVMNTMIVLAAVMSEAFRKGGLAALQDTAAIIEEAGRRLAELEKKKDRTAKAPGPVDVRYSTAEEFGRENQKRILQASALGGDKAAKDPAKIAEAQRAKQIGLLEDIKNGIGDMAGGQAAPQFSPVSFPSPQLGAAAGGVGGAGSGEAFQSTANKALQFPITAANTGKDLVSGQVSEVMDIIRGFNDKLDTIGQYFRLVR